MKIIKGFDTETHKSFRIFFESVRKQRKKEKGKE